MSVCVYPVYMSCEHRRTVHQYKLCIVVQYICTWIYIYKPICLEYVLFTWVVLFAYIDVVFVDGRGPFRCPEIWNFLKNKNRIIRNLFLYISSPCNCVSFPCQICTKTLLIMSRFKTFREDICWDAFAEVSP
jgi:hypothetical protein